MKSGVKGSGLVLFFAAMMLTFVFSASAAAQKDDGPAVHNFAGSWQLRQSNGFVVNMKLSQNSRGEITGTATTSSRTGVSTGTVSGRAWRTNAASWPDNIDTFRVEIAWNGPVGVYIGTASWAEGLLKGATFQKDKPSAKANWSAGPFARRR